MSDLENVIKNWNALIGEQSGLLREQLSELEISALSACMGDCYQSFNEVYCVLLEKLKKAAPDDYDLVHDCIVDIYWEFDHIKNHIADAEKGFSVLMNLLAKKAELKEQAE
jgi:hypothetical protein